MHLKSPIWSEDKVWIQTLHATYQHSHTIESESPNKERPQNITKTLVTFSPKRDIITINLTHSSGYSHVWNVTGKKDTFKSTNAYFNSSISKCNSLKIQNFSGWGGVGLSKLWGFGSRGKKIKSISQPAFSTLSWILFISSARSSCSHPALEGAVGSKT